MAKKELISKEEAARRIALAVEEYNRKNPDRPITGSDIFGKRRGGFFGKVALFCEGAWDAITDQLPEDMARFIRGGDTGGKDWQSQIIERQKKDKAARIPSYEEAIGDEQARDAYSAMRDIPTNMVAGGAGMLAGMPTGPAGSFIGGIGSVIGTYGRIARDRFNEEMQTRFEAEHGRKPDGLETALLNREVKKDADKYVLDQAFKEGKAQALGSLVAGPAKGLLKPVIDNFVGEAVSPDRAFDGEGIYRGLNFQTLDQDRQTLPRNQWLDSDYNPRANFFEQLGR